MKCILTRHEIIEESKNDMEVVTDAPMRELLIFENLTSNPYAK